MTATFPDFSGKEKFKNSRVSIFRLVLAFTVCWNSRKRGIAKHQQFILIGIYVRHTLAKSLRHTVKVLMICVF